MVESQQDSVQKAVPTGGTEESQEKSNDSQWDRIQQSKDRIQLVGGVPAPKAESKDPSKAKPRVTADGRLPPGQLVRFVSEGGHRSDCPLLLWPPLASSFPPSKSFQYCQATIQIVSSDIYCSLGEVLGCNQVG